ncbi:nonribosomal peptide synthase [Trichoderma cornu-damae]|uniref:Nonribosomal peptide synthase n=1 Tax=Trichoderma cornu-damae TaxID=654480 RepID=A0A9P8QG38_9HYPO|nr:nonribosomal peptide synthase [Trichoderma cornu-damae]
MRGQRIEVGEIEYQMKKLETTIKRVAVDVIHHEFLAAFVSFRGDEDAGGPDRFRRSLWGKIRWDADGNNRRVTGRLAVVGEARSIKGESEPAADTLAAYSSFSHTTPTSSGAACSTPTPNGQPSSGLLLVFAI